MQNVLRWLVALRSMQLLNAHLDCNDLKNHSIPSRLNSIQLWEEECQQYNITMFWCKQLLCNYCSIAYQHINTL